MREGNLSLQLEKREVCVGIIGFLLALLDDVFLEDTGGFGIVSIKAIQDRINVLWPVGRVVERNPHFGVTVQEELEIRSRLESVGSNLATSGVTRD